MYPRLIATLLAVFALLLSACPQETSWTPEQKEVHDALLAWSTTVSNRDARALWDMLSPDAREAYDRELKGPGGVRQTVKMSQAALKLEARTPEEERDRLRKLLARLPENPDDMTAKDYYIWRVTPELTQEGAERTARLFAKGNISEISIEGEKATVILENGSPDRYSWVRHDGVWKFDLHPSILRALEDARKRESQ